MKNPFTAHPNSVDETYWQHFRTAWWFALRLCGACLACAIHAIFPFLFKCTASKTVSTLHDKMTVNRNKCRP